METILERNQITIEDEMRRSYLDYAMSVIIGRALPDVRDGLKPVHRRVLWAMNELGNTHNKAYKKSARIVGDCFVKGTLVHTEHGLKPIEEIEIGENVLLPNGYLSSVVEAYKNPPAPVVELHISNGSSMKITNGQLFRVLNDDLSITWERADNLEGKRILVSGFRSLGITEEHPSRERVNAAYIAGLIVAEGFLSDRGRSRRVGIGMIDKEPLELVASYCNEKNINARWHERKPKQLHHKPFYTLRFTGLDEAYDICQHTSEGKRVPQWILSDRRLFAPFIAGFVDGDGFVRAEDSRRDAILTSTSKSLLTTIQVMLADYGLHSNISLIESPARLQKENYLPCYTLTISGLNASRFGNLLAPYLKVSSKRDMAVRLSNWSGKVLNSSTECVPSQAIFAELSAYHLGAGWYQDKEGRKFRSGVKYQTGTKIRYSSDLHEKTLSFRQIEEWGILNKLERIDSPLAEKLRHLINNYSVLNVVSVVNNGENAENFDIQIEEAEHEFLVQGCAVHNCIGKYHPHGDTAVYDTLVRMAQEFSMRYPLVDGQGNFGSVDGDSAAAMRYTEARMSRLTNEVLADIEKETVDFRQNYDESLSEPTVLPTRIPNLLINGSEGIAVGMATKIPPHNLTEILDATIAIVRKPHIPVSDLLQIVTGPDFPTGAIIYGREGIRSAYVEGRGIIQMRARAGVDRVGRGNHERDAIVVTEIPYQVNKARLIENIAELVNDKKLDGISDLRDESNREGMRIVIELKRDAIPQIVLNKLYKMTQLQTSFGVINLSIIEGQPRILPLKEMLEAFIEFRREVIRRRTEYELRKAKARAHILEGLNKAIDALDYIIPTIRNSRSTDEAKAWLTAQRFETMAEVKQWRGASTDLTLHGFIQQLQKVLNTLGFSDAQAQAILDLQLRRLSALERQKILDEYEQIIKHIEELEYILAHESALRQVIIKELEEVKRIYGDKRRTEIIDSSIELNIEDLIADEDVAITVTKAGYIKRTPVSTYSSQIRGGKGRLGASAKNEDFVQHLFIASTHSYIMMFTDDGQVFKIKVHELPDLPTSARGKAFVNLVNIPTERKLAGIIPVREFSEGRNVLFVTRKGTIKKTPLSDYQNIRVNGINAINIDEGDELLDVVLTDGTKQIFIATHNGLAIRFDESQARPMGRATRGVRGIDLRTDDFVVALCAVSKEGSERLLSVSEQGYGKQTKVTDYRLQSRGGKGVINMKTTQKTGKVVAVFPVEDDSEIMIITQQAKLIRIEADGIRKTGRSAQGVRLIKTDPGDMVTSASLIDPSNNQEGEE